ncbi:ATP-binding protein [Shewanella glacialimarina]|uniref:ATP-binding protein n=1 Tax=Shewanella glacialimarina TaxID=2590884 RepID=UPI001CF87228|nr:ATP-binding protein [Shewanella glacialimarina]UCX03264.1 HAMP domain-containing protein [Shewanella glacialimarina]
MSTTNPLNRLFFKLLIGFWLCSSLTIALVLILPIIMQNQDRAPIEKHLQQVLQTVAKDIQQSPDILITDKLYKLQRQHSRQNKPLRVYLVNDGGQVINSRKVPRSLRQFLLMAEDAKQPISHQFRNELIFGPLTFSVNQQTFQVYGRVPANHPRPWFFYFSENKLLTASIAILFSGILCGLLAWHLGKPLNSLKRSANAIAKGDLSHRVDKTTVSRSDEMGQLAMTFNSMADSIEVMVTNQQRLMGDISHELRTPLTRLKLSLALARKKGQDSTELTRIEYEANQLDDLIGELLTLSRVTLNASEIKIYAELSETLSQVLDDAEFEAEQQNKQLHIHIDDSLAFEHYPKHLCRAIENVLRNAIRYAASQISIEATQQSHSIVISIIDDGPGIDEHELEAIFRPFYRPDNARDRISGGWGLGLAITQAAIQAHNGDIKALNNKPNGLHIKLNIPI